MFTHVLTYQNMHPFLQHFKIEKINIEKTNSEHLSPVTYFPQILFTQNVTMHTIPY